MDKLQLYDAFMRQREPPTPPAPPAPDPDIVPHIKSIFSRIGSDTPKFWRLLGIMPKPFDTSFLHKLERKSEVVSAVINSVVEDVMSTGYKLVKRDGVRRAKTSEYRRAIEFFNKPSKSDRFDAWMSNFVHDVVYYSNAYIEIGGFKDHKVIDSEGREVWVCPEDKTNFINMVTTIPAYTMRGMYYENGELPEPPEAAFVQRVGGHDIYFASNKVYHITNFAYDGPYGVSPLQALIEVITGSINLTHYISKLYEGNVPKHLVNLGQLDDKTLRRTSLLMRQQLDVADNPYGLVLMSIPGDQFKIQRIFDTANEGKFLETLRYYREQVAASFGVPLQRLGWAESNKPMTPAQEDAYYDITERRHKLIEKLLNNYILPRLGVKTWVVRYKSPRPQKYDNNATIAARFSIANERLRRQHTLTINESRQILSSLIEIDLPPIDDERADDPFYTPPQPQPLLPIGTESASGKPDTGGHKPGEGEGSVDK